MTDDQFITEEDINVMKNKAERLFLEYGPDDPNYPMSSRSDEDPVPQSKEEEFEEMKKKYGFGTGKKYSKLELRTLDDLLTLVDIWENLNYENRDIKDAYYRLTGVDLSVKAIQRRIQNIHKSGLKKLQYDSPEEREKARKEYVSTVRKSVSSRDRERSREAKISSQNRSRPTNSERFDAFDGKVYKQESLLSRTIIDQWKKKSLKNIIRGKTEYVRHFVLGYQIKWGNVFYEIWYNTQDATFEIIDRHGYPVHRDIRDLTTAVDWFIDMISDKSVDDRVRDAVYRDSRDSLRSARSLGILESKEDEWVSIDKFFDQQLFECSEVDQEPVIEHDQDYLDNTKTLLEQTAGIRQIIRTTIEDEMQEYFDSELDRNDVKKLLFGIASRKLTDKERRDLGTIDKVKVILKRGVRNFFRLKLSDINVDFIVGFKIKDTVKTEVWEVTRERSNRSAEFYVVDVTSRRVLRRGFKNLRQAIDVIRDRFLVKYDG